MEIDRQKRNFVEELGPEDVGIIFKKDGKLKLYLLDHSKEDAEKVERKYSDSEILVMALGKLLGYKPFVENVVNMFFKIIEETEKKISEISKDVEREKKVDL